MSGALSKKLGRLEDFLSSEAVDQDAMQLSELDSFLAGKIVCPHLILSHVEFLHRARLAQANPFTASVNKSPEKVGRNDPCPCGSGKKFKKCCLN